MVDALCTNLEVYKVRWARVVLQCFKGYVWPQEETFFHLKQTCEFLIKWLLFDLWSLWVLTEGSSYWCIFSTSDFRQNQTHICFTLFCKKRLKWNNPWNKVRSTFAWNGAEETPHILCSPLSARFILATTYYHNCEGNEDERDGCWVASLCRLL